jgi:formylglycine-generating enzyme required for sulfatase activity
MALNLAVWSVCAANLPSIRADDPRQQASSADTASPAGQSASAPSPQELEQARAVFRQLMRDGNWGDADKARVERLIAQLGNDRWLDREAAQSALAKESPAALPLIRRACESNDLEIAIRAANIVASLKACNRAMALRGAIAARHLAGEAAIVGDLVSLLSSEEIEIRYAAGRGLLRTTGRDFGFLAGAEPDRRAQAARKARQWWQENQASFTMKPPAGPSPDMALDLGGGFTMDLVLIPAGKFTMGSPGSEKGREEKEGPCHEVTISKAFYMGIHTVTQGQWTAVTGAEPWKGKGDVSEGVSHPAVQITWDAAVEFCARLSRKTGKAVRLPTEAEWEYACRAGSKTPFFYGEDPNAAELGDYAWYETNCRGGSHPVGQKKPNAWGLYDMQGNVWQWCADWYDEKYYAVSGGVDPVGPDAGTFRVTRGGGRYDTPVGCRSACRRFYAPFCTAYCLGFRVVVDLK